MKIVIDWPDKKVREFVKSILENLPDYCICLRCSRWNYDKCEFEILEDPDDEGTWDVKHTLTLDKAVKAFEELVQKWLDRRAYTLEQLMDDGYWDAPMVDSLVQVAVLGEEVYG